MKQNATTIQGIASSNSYLRLPSVTDNLLSTI